MSGVSAAARWGLADDLDAKANDAAELVSKLHQQAALERAHAAVLDIRDDKAAALATAQAELEQAEEVLAAAGDPWREAADRARQALAHLEKCQRAEKQGRRDKLPPDQLAALRRDVTAAAEISGELAAEAAQADQVKQNAAALAEARADAVTAARDELEAAEKALDDPLSADLSYEARTAILMWTYPRRAFEHGIAEQASMIDGALSGFRLLNETEREIVRDLADLAIMAVGYKGWKALNAELSEVKSRRESQQGFAISRDAAAAIASIGR